VGDVETPGFRGHQMPGVESMVRPTHSAGRSLFLRSEVDRRKQAAPVMVADMLDEGDHR